jgi:hypothetical protein
MKVKIGEIYMDEVTGQKTIFPNKTRKFLLPCLKEYGTDFMNKLNNVFKVAAGIGDIVTDNCGQLHEKHIFILLNSTIANKFFLSFIEWIKEQPMYVDDYVFGNIQKSKFHMVVLRVPEKFNNSFDAFKESKYSSMFTEEVIGNFFTSITDKMILGKDVKYKLRFTRKLNKFFGTDVKPEEWEGELELPLNEEEEIFNPHLKKKK